MEISVIGLGYVGAVCCGVLADLGHRVIGVDSKQEKVDTLAAGESPVVEPELPEMIARAVASGRLTATMSASQAIRETDISLICVGTPSLPNGNLDLRYIRSACAEVGHAIAHKQRPHLVVIRSTVIPGTMRDVIIPELEEATQGQVGADFQIAANPEFLREGTAVADFLNPPMTVIGALDHAAASTLADVYKDIQAPVQRVSLELAEMIKYTCNAWHALKVSFANEIGSLAAHAGIDGREVMDIICQDEKLNISAKYMKPGMPFGGSCLPKDLRALNYYGRRHDVETPLLGSVLPSNDVQIQRIFHMVTMGNNSRRVGLLGLSFKPGTDDVRESPLVTLAEMLLGKGYDVSIYDPNVDYARLHGANRDYLMAMIPHVTRLLVKTVDEVVQASDTVVIGHYDRAYLDCAALGTKRIIDFVGLADGLENVSGICW